MYQKNTPKAIKFDPQIAQKTIKNLSKINAEIEIGKRVEKWRPRPIESEPIFDQNRSKMTSKNHQKIDAEKVSQNDAKMTGKESKMEPK